MLIEYISRMDLRLYQWMCTILQISRDCVKLFDPARYFKFCHTYWKWKRRVLFVHQTYILQTIYYKIYTILKHFCCTNKFSTRSKFLKRDVLGSTSRIHKCMKRKYEYWIYNELSSFRYLMRFVNRDSSFHIISYLPSLYPDRW